MKSVPQTTRYCKFLTLSLLLGVALSSAKKMLEMDGNFIFKKTNQNAERLTLNQRFSLYGNKELPPKPNKTQPVQSDVVSTEEYFEKDMEDYYDVQLFSKIYVGSNKQPFDLILDTGSGWTWVQGKQCRTCPTYDRFDTSASSTYRQTSSNDEYIFYGTGTVMGTVSEDQVCISQSACAQNVSLLVIKKTWDLEGLYADGIMGMSPTSQDGSAELVIDELYKQNVIDEKVFSIQVGDNFEPSKITIGGYDAEKYAKEPIQWHDLANKMYWTINMDKVNFNNTDLEIETREVIVDSGTSYLLMPTKDFSIFSRYFDTRYECWVDPYLYGLYVCTCSSQDYESYPDMDIQIGSESYKLTKENYIVKEGNMCVFKIMQMDFRGQNPFWILGLTFFHNYYTVFDQQNSRIGFAESKLSSLPERTTPAVVNLHLTQAAPIETASSSLFNVLGLIVGLAALVIIGKQIKKRMNKHYKSQFLPEIDQREVFLKA